MSMTTVWAARDDCGGVFLYAQKPRKDDAFGFGTYEFSPRKTDGVHPFELSPKTLGLKCGECHKVLITQQKETP